MIWSRLSTILLSLNYFHSCDVWHCGVERATSCSLPMCQQFDKYPKSQPKQSLTFFHFFTRSEEWRAMQTNRWHPLPPSVPVEWWQRACAPSPHWPCPPPYPRPPRPTPWRPPRPTSGLSWPSCLSSGCTPSSARCCGSALAMQSNRTSHGWKYSRVLSTK